MLIALQITNQVFKIIIATQDPIRCGTKIIYN